MKKNDVEKLITSTITKELELLKNDLRKKYEEILDEMNKNGTLYSGITRKNVSKEGTEVIKNHLGNLFSTFDEFPLRIKKEYWLNIETSLQKEIENLEKEYSNELIKIADPHTTVSNAIFQDAEKQLKLLIKDHVLKSRVEGFESEASYRMKAEKRSKWALCISIISLIISIAIFLFK